MQATALALNVGQIKSFVRANIGPLRLSGLPAQHAEHAVVCAENATDRSAGVNVKRLQFAEQEQSPGLIYVRARQNDALNRRISNSVAGTESFGMQRGRRFNLDAEVRRGVQQKPVFAVTADGNLGLCSWFPLKCAGTNRSAIRAGTIPLRKAASGCGAQNLNPHAPLKRGADIGIDFAAQADFIELRGCPVHGQFLILQVNHIATGTRCATERNDVAVVQLAWKIRIRVCKPCPAQNTKQPA